MATVNAGMGTVSPVATGGVAHTLNTTTNFTSGTLLSVSNNSVSRFSVNYAGDVSAGKGTFSVSAPSGADVVVFSGTNTNDSATVTLSFTSANNPQSASRGLHLGKQSADPDPLAIIFDVDSTTKWELGIDMDNDDFILAAIPGVNDILRLNPEAQMQLGYGIGSPDNNGIMWRVKANANLIGMASDVLGNYAGLAIRQMSAGTKRAKIEFATYLAGTQTTFYQMGTDLSQNGTADFWIADGSATRFFINAAGRVGVGVTSNLAAKVHIDQSSTTGATPALLLDQADVSEEFVRFVGEAAAATLTQSIVAEAAVTTATRAGFVKVYVQDDGNQITDQAYYLPIYTLA